ncbi:DUF6283 family protein [Acinetobacter brisouii]|uniref:DUF6283 family protein n=1 Tax=Acinetobacter brisouii TaxID=396323 RepID=UPI00124DBB4C|nr:DUF6283 family protein [Acinetobacter brisouii]
MFKLKRPCKNCPFRNDVEIQKGWLGEARARNIYEDTLLAGKVFPCHKTVEHEDYEGDDPQQFALQPQNNFCAGALILMEKNGDAIKSNAIRMAERLRLYDHKKLDMNSPVFETADEFITWHKNSYR